MIRIGNPLKKTPPADIGRVAMSLTIGMALTVILGTSIPAVGEPVRTVTVRLSEYHFEPSEIGLTAGEEIELVLVNEGRVKHEFISEALRSVGVELEVGGVEIEALGVEEIEVEPKATVKLRFAIPRAGAYPFACRGEKPKDHRREGMRGHFSVR